MYRILKKNTSSCFHAVSNISMRMTAEGAGLLRQTSSTDARLVTPIGFVSVRSGMKNISGALGQLRSDGGP